VGFGGASGLCVGFGFVGLCLGLCGFAFVGFGFAYVGFGFAYVGFGFAYVGKAKAHKAHFCLGLIKGFKHLASNPTK